MAWEDNGFYNDCDNVYNDDLIEREMTTEETIEYLKKNVAKYEKEIIDHGDHCLKTMTVINEYELMCKQLSGEIPMQKYYTGKRREYAYEAAEEIILFNNFNKIKHLSDDQLFIKVALKFISYTENDIQENDENINQRLTVRDRMYIEEGIKRAKGYLDFEWFEGIIEEYNWSTIKGDELLDLVKEAQKQLIEQKTKYLEELVAAGERILFTKYSYYFHHSVDVPLGEYVAAAKKFRAENWGYVQE